MHGLIFNIISHNESRTVGAHLIASYLREHNWDIEVADWAHTWTLEELQAFARSRINKNTKWIGFSHLFSRWSITLEEFCVWLKITWPDLVLVSGGNVSPRFDTNTIDYYISGYGEYAILELLKYLFSNGTPVKFTLAGRKLKKIIPANDFYRAAPKHQIRAVYEERDFIFHDEWLATQTSRGCVFSCDFCNVTMVGVKSDFTRDAKDFDIEMRENYDRFGVKNYIVADETFNDRLDKVIKYADVVEQLPFVPYYAGYIRPDLLVNRPGDREQLLRMNFLGHFYGVESFNRPSAKVVGKGLDSEKLKQGLIDARQYFESTNRKLYHGKISLIAGLPYETFESLENTLNWLLEHWTGHNWTMETLVIERGEFTQPSKMSLDFRKYGYEEMSPDDIAKYNLTDPALRKIVNPDYMGFGPVSWNNDAGVMLWKNDITDALETTVWVESRAKEIRRTNHFSPAPHTLSRPRFVGAVEDRIAYCKEWPPIENRDPPQNTKNNFNKMLDTYKTQKINYRG